MDISVNRITNANIYIDGAGLLVAGRAQEWHNWYYGLILPAAAAGGTVASGR